MANTHTTLRTHIVFSTKNRLPFLENQEIRQRVHEYMGGICREHKSPALAIGGIADHVHLLVSLAKTVALSALVLPLKRNSSIWIKKTWPSLENFAWQTGYGAFAVTAGRSKTVMDYIFNQEAHHRNVGFRQEYVSLLDENMVDYDEQYLWD